MTIFLAIAKDILQREITAIRDESLSSDNSYLNQGLMFLGYGRKVDVSSEKRELLSTLTVKIKELAAGENDAENYANLLTLISTCRKAGAQKSSLKKLDEGNFGPSMIEIEHLLEAIYEQLKTLNFSDVPKDEDPLNTFRYYAALYYSEKIVEQYQLSITAKLLEHPDLSSIRELTAKKKESIITIVGLCMEDLETLDKEHPRYEETRSSHVIDWIEKLQRENNALCYRLSSLFFKPKPGRLDECMGEAIVAIKDSKKVEPVEHKVN